MRYFLIILLLGGFSVYGQCTKVVNGITVPCSAEDIAQRAIDSAAYVADSSENNRRTRFENRVAERQSKLIRAYFYASKQLNDARYRAFVEDTRNERGNYPYSPDGLIEWLNGVVFSGKNYYSLELKNGLLNRLQ